MIDSLQLQDPDITRIVASSKFVVAYLLQQDGPNPGWRKANIEGPVYIVQRRTQPRYQLLVKNQLHANDLLDTLHADWELDCQKNYVFYKVQDPRKRIRGLWFHDDAERQKIEGILEKTLQEVRNGPPEMQAEPEPVPLAQDPQVAGLPEPPVQVQPEPVPQAPPMQMQQSPPIQVQEHVQADQLYNQFGLNAPPAAATEDTVTLSMASLRSALHALADDETFCKMVMQKLKGQAAHSRGQ